MRNFGWNLKHSYMKLPEMFYSEQKPSACAAPEVVMFNHELAAELGLDASPLKEAADILCGNTLPAGAKPIAQAYAGYQFGHFATLGDGRAVLLGEQVFGQKRVDVQLKGSGRTPYSRRGDGLAALLPMLREYIISEAMAALGIPTTRSLAVVRTGGQVIRETALPGAVLVRTAASHIRVGTFNYAAAFGTKEDVAELADYTIWRHFPLLESESNRYLLMFRETALRQADLIAKWQLTGFIHGVMNTDNTAISGETIDYGPCAFMDTYNPGTVFSSIDTNGRYAYKNQPDIGAWNLARLAEAILPMLHEDAQTAVEIAREELSRYWWRYHGQWLGGMRAKLGISNEEDGDEALIDELLGLMAAERMDYTQTFLVLSEIRRARLAPALVVWHQKWLARLKRQELDVDDAEAFMRTNNPAVIPRNHHVEQALAAAGQGDMSHIEDLLAHLRKPYEKSKKYGAPPESCDCGYKTFCGT